MASAGLNFTNLTPSNGAVQELKELIFLALADVEGLGGLVNFIPGQVNGHKVGFIGDFGMLGKASSGCNPEYGTDLISTSEKTWDIAEWEIAEKICYSDLKGTLAQLALKTKTSVDDLTGTEYMDGVLAPRIERAVKKLAQRIVWFSDKDATVYSAENTDGTLKPGQDAGHFTMTDGFWKRAFAAVAGGTMKRVTVAANAATSIAAQKAAIKGAGVAMGIIEEMITEAPAVLRQQDGLRIYVSQALADALTLDYRHQNVGSDLQWNALKDGIRTTVYAGVEIIAMPYWDEIIQNSLQNTTNTSAYELPYRAVLTIKDNLLVGSESENEAAEVEVNFDNITRYNHIFAKDTLGTLFAQDDLAVVAY